MAPAMEAVLFSTVGEFNGVAGIINMRFAVAAAVVVAMSILVLRVRRLWDGDDKSASHKGEGAELERRRCWGGLLLD